ncbi:hypothetical protein AB205_0140900 [Aquarana catesbeiana]|uniref:SH3 domain-containing protein n=1 Tax=Aquarana catesbeiana TaxID=8400 RepID=A0A2G9RPM3_AQUCT|nr:hypothetical protein AB205_0140900 [Aquarana catesbeiana]
MSTNVPATEICAVFMHAWCERALNQCSVNQKYYFISHQTSIVLFHFESLQARGKKRQIGWFPANYVKLLSPGTNKSTPTEPPKPAVLPTTCQVIGMYDYIAQNDDELAFSKGQVINVLNKEDPDWWKGELNGQVGLFPSNYVKLTTDMDPSQQNHMLSIPLLRLESPQRDPLSPYHCPEG